MHQNPSEIEADNKRLLSKVVVPKIKFSLEVAVFSRREQVFFQSTVFLYFMKVVAIIHSSMDTVHLEEHLNCVYTMYLTDI